jgi:hypothetical protein
VATPTRSRWCPPPEATNALGVVRVPLPAEVPDGGRVTIRFEVQAPAQSGVYTYAWALARGTAETLQQTTAPGEVTVQDSADCTRPGPAARFRAQETPAAFIGVGETVRGRMTFANCGADTWRRDDGFALHSALPDGSTPWGTTRVELPRDVPFGAEVTFDIEGAAPATQGRYRWAWAVQRRGDPLGPPSPEAQITALRRATCGEHEHPVALRLAERPRGARPRAGRRRRHHLRQLRRRRVGRLAPDQRRRPGHRRALGRGATSRCPSTWARAFA